MEVFLAHSAKDGIPAQSYEEHIRGVCEKAVRYAKEAESYAVDGSGILSAVAGKSASLHDLGKLEDQNQKVLRGLDNKQQHLPINHVDAGSAALKAENCLYSALTVYAHHIGLPALSHARNDQRLAIGRIFPFHKSLGDVSTHRETPFLTQVRKRRTAPFVYCIKNRIFL